MEVVFDFFDLNEDFFLKKRALFNEASDPRILYLSKIGPAVIPKLWFCTDQILMMVFLRFVMVRPIAHAGSKAKLIFVVQPFFKSNSFAEKLAIALKVFFSP